MLGIYALVYFFRKLNCNKKLPFSFVNPKRVQKQPSRGALKKEKVFWKHSAHLQENIHAKVKFE